MRDQYLYNFKASIGCGLEQWRVSSRITIIHVCAIFGEPRRYRIVAACHGPGQRSVASPIRRDSVHIRAHLLQIARDVFVPERSGAICLTQRVRDALVKAKLTNMTLARLSEIHRLVLHERPRRRWRRRRA